MNVFKPDSEQKITTGFTVPENYFENFSERILSEISKPEVKVISINQSNRNWIYAAAAVLVLSLTIPTLNRFSSSTQTDTPNSAEIENYLSYQPRISDDVLVDLLQTEDIDNIKIDYKLEDKAMEDALSNLDLENYILN